MAVSIYDRTFLNEDQQAKLAALTDEWNRANAAGDQAGKVAAHNAAEDIRRQYSSYSGGADGSGYIKLSQPEKYEAARLPTYTAQTDAVNRVYDAAAELQKAQLKTAYDANLATLEAAKAKLPEQYKLQRNAVGARSELSRANFNEHAAAWGLNSGTGGQAELARQNALQGNLAALDRDEANAMVNAETGIARLKTTYQNEVAAALAKGEYERATALLNEYRTREQSAVSVAKGQADENYRAWSSERSDRDARYNRDLQEASARAQFGDFSGYSALGYDGETIANMTSMWIAQNPLLAYNTGMIGAGEYRRMTGKRPPR